MTRKKPGIPKPRRRASQMRRNGHLDIAGRKSHPLSTKTRTKRTTFVPPTAHGETSSGQPAWLASSERSTMAWYTRLMCKYSVSGLTCRATVTSTLNGPSTGMRPVPIANRRSIHWSVSTDVTSHFRRCTPALTYQTVVNDEVNGRHLPLSDARIDVTQCPQS